MIDDISPGYTRDAELVEDGRFRDNVICVPLQLERPAVVWDSGQGRPLQTGMEHYDVEVAGPLDECSETNTGLTHVL